MDLEDYPNGCENHTDIETSYLLKEMAPVADWDRRNCPKCNGTLKAKNTREYIVTIAEGKHTKSNKASKYYPCLITEEATFYKGEFFDIECINCQAKYTWDDILVYLGN
ncbi:MAG: hypothetical protein EOM67_13870 [Spirochaetia bacterium]|nr:hypothetical protein [Spirochaetia bacterium]